MNRQMYWQNLTHLVTIPTYRHPIRYQDSIMIFGSCFAQRIQKHLHNLLYHYTTSPFGISYNPSSIAQGLISLIQDQHFDESLLFNYRERWHSPWHHSSYSHPQRETCLQQIQQAWYHTQQKLKTCRYLMITLGTAWVYHDAQYGIVNNCHQRPARDFTRFRLDVSTMTQLLSEAQKAIWKVNPHVQFIYTVSPIRHLKDGAIENQRSKASLLLTIDALQNQTPQQCFYFPSYEIMMDELRDYRFYKDDLIHPSDCATQLICDLFTQYCLCHQQESIRHHIMQLQKNIAHKPRHPNSIAHQKHKQKIQASIQQLKTHHPYLNYNALECSDINSILGGE